MTTEDTGTQTAATEQPAQTQTAEISLEDVYKEAGVSLPPATSGYQPTQQPQPQHQPQQPEAMPDPFTDTDRFKAWMGERVKNESALGQSYQQISGVLNEFQKTQNETKLKQDLAKSVEAVNEHVQLPDNQKKLIEFALEDKARSDPRFKQLWDNRDRNPIAWSRALQAVSKDIGETFSVKVDPQIRADRQALKVSQSQSATTRTPDGEDPAWMSLPSDSPEFQYNWNRLSRNHQ